MRRMADMATSHWPFMKMHGAGNDFVVIDGRNTPVDLTESLVRALADRHRGVGFDQLALITDGSDLTVTFYNADGSQSAACGNATRCIAAHELALRAADHLDIHVTGRGMLNAVRNDDGSTAVNMGHPQLDWQDIPLAKDVDTLSLPIDGDPVGTGMGNPHCTFFVDDVSAIDLATIGPKIEHHTLFPERTNVQFAQVVGPDHIRMRVWERGTGVTLASGSSSCATAVAAARRGLTGHKVQIDLDGGTLHIDWRDDGVWMSGPTAHVFDGTLTTEFLQSL
ncbi:diaminopimelate epimerase [uncultured Tateyamaria sp.]|uniref:diaminopimelate epimerase n=1 Tax=uncultured Tateyamaria sp. TaxID=455651 RepID=UPI00263765A4|nr:diaminopimelate epimerase [uncultured Tateyamaria sp.]